MFYLIRLRSEKEITFSMTLIQNPVLTGFHPDPSLVRVEEDYYIATSTFEWFPGVRIYHSRDLAHWRFVCSPLDRVSQLDLKGCQNSGGVWAPCLTYADGKFWLVYTNVRHHGAGVVMDTPNYLVTSEQIEGPWSDPVYLNSSGFDPSLFHDTDGKKYLVQMQMGEAFTDRRFDGILLQEFDPERMCLTGAGEKIWEGSPLGVTEGPHLIRKDGWVYLITAEGGTGLRHAVSVCRSRELRGPYTLHPENPILTSLGDKDSVFTSSGHASFVELPDGEWVMAHLSHRPLPRASGGVGSEDGALSAMLGRETCIQRVDWPQGDWPVLAGGGSRPYREVEVNLPAHPWPPAPVRREFSRSGLPSEFQTLREPVDESWCSFQRRPGWLSLRGRDSLASVFDQSLVARRRQHFYAMAETRMSFCPLHMKQSAGLLAYYDRLHYHYFRVTSAGEGRLKLGVLSSVNSRHSRVEAVELPLESGAHLRLRMECRGADLEFAWTTDGRNWVEVDGKYDAGALGDWVSPISNFTGTFWGICCQDLLDRSIWAEFAYFDYKVLM